MPALPSSTIVYCRGEDVLARYDARLVLPLCVDDDLAALPDLSNIDQNSKFNAARIDATADINRALRRSNKYSREVLNRLITEFSNPAPAYERYAELVAIACGRCVYHLMKSRFMSGDVINQTNSEAGRSEILIDQLSNGVLVLDLEGVAEAGLPSAGTPSLSDRSRPTFWNPMFGSFHRRGR